MNVKNSRLYRLNYLLSLVGIEELGDLALCDQNIPRLIK